MDLASRCNWVASINPLRNAISSMHAILKPCRASIVCTNCAACNSDFMRARIQPGEAATESLDVELAAAEIGAIDVGDLQLAARGGFQSGRDLEHLIVVKVQPRHGVGGAGLSRLFFERQNLAGSVKLHDPVPLGILHRIAKDRGAVVSPRGRPQHVLETLAVEQVVAQHQGAVVAADKLAPDNERLCQALRPGLHGVLNGQSDRAAVAQQPLKAATSCGVEINSTCRMPASISTDSG